MSLTFKWLEGVRWGLLTRVDEDPTKELVMAEQWNLMVKGMTCTGCEERTTTALEVMPGVEDPSVDNEAGTVTLRFDPTVADDDAVRGAIEELGYRVVV